MTFVDGTLFDSQCTCFNRGNAVPMRSISSLTVGTAFPFEMITEHNGHALDHIRLRVTDTTVA